MALTYNIPAMMAHRARACGDHPALVEGGAALSFEALERRVGWWANPFASFALARVGRSIRGSMP